MRYASFVKMAEESYKTTELFSCEYLKPILSAKQWADSTVKPVQSECTSGRSLWTGGRCSQMPSRVGLVYDERMAKHNHPTDEKHVENPRRITVPYTMLRERGILDKCLLVPSRLANDAELEMVHSKSYIQTVKSYTSETSQNICKLQENWPTYISNSAYESAACAVGCLLSMVDDVMSGKVDKGVAIVRPPGHHAETNESCGFCFFNTVAIATKYAQLQYPKAKKVMILDWDIHHGNGIQHVFYDDPTVLYVSLHRFDNGDYFPGLRESSHEFMGNGDGAGFNVNIPWTKSKMGDMDYKLAFDKVVMPIASQFQPDLIIVAAGFDAAAADPLGEYVLSPDIYAYMTQQLLMLANGHVILSLEGGYNVKANGEALAACTNVLLGDFSVDIKSQEEPCKKALQAVAMVMSCQSQYWDFSRPAVR